ncbi:hypothetical protein KUD97_07830 [Desulfovibrio desulfuricans]|uniref:Prohibitin family protein n=1 Tax=Desulfovibrio phage ProddE TaxID=2866661 RepID=A0AAE9BMG3_9CAUD|nr:SPFH domain-containing protein [Desulfovibrio desulfuricans]UAJ16890.1 putative prohibitin family protein [Desulfovibrio phage ProddE]UIA98901.1 hypothetical protein KUD97_07830 [Desulfovibrio desulfuricans]
MKWFKTFLPVVFLLLLPFITTGCSKVEAGYVGVKVYLLGGSKGVDSEVVGVGRYWVGWNEELYKFPTFQQTVVWDAADTKESPGDNSFTFQTKEGLSVNADVSLSYTINPEKVAQLFQRYRKGVDEITNVYLRNVVRDALVQAASTRGVESIYGEGKADIIDDVTKAVASRMADIGINIDYVAFVGDLRLPKNVISSINSKIEATQRAQQRENELREARAEADKKVAAAEGEAKSSIAKAEGEAKATIIRAEAQAKANKLLSESVTENLIRYRSAERWDGKMPQVSGSATPFVTLK